MLVRYVAQLCKDKQGLRAVNVFADTPAEHVVLEATSTPTQPPPEAGAFVEVEASEAGTRIVSTLAAPGSARAQLFELLSARSIDPNHPAESIAEVERLAASPGIDDSTLLDLRHLPFVTVDGENTRDLDQALYVEEKGEGFVAHYAIADAAHFVRPGMRLFIEALRRGASFYLPGLSVPMLPRALSEDLISLNAAVDRRAMVFEMHIDGDGECTRTEIRRARIHCRHKLTFEDVGAVLAAKAEPHRSDDVRISLQAFAKVGKLRLQRAARRNVVQHRNAEVQVTLADSGNPVDAVRFVALERSRNDVELYNEQLSLLCNVEGARMLRDGGGKTVQAIFRTHDSPEPERLSELERLIHAATGDRNLGQEWLWDRSRQTLAQYLNGLPQTPQQDGLARAIARQAIMVNVRSNFSTHAGPHFGIGADVYARFSAPMREIVGVFVHKEMWELLGTSTREATEDEALRGHVIDAANRSKQTQRELTHAANRLVIDQLFAPDLAMPREDRPARTAVVMGLRNGKVYVQLNDPPIDIKLYTRELDPSLVVDEECARVTRSGEVFCRLGDEVRVRLAGYEAERGRWITELVG